MHDNLSKAGPGKKYGYLWVTMAFFILSLIGHWVFGWYEYVSEAQQHGQTPAFTEYFVLLSRGTLENWQSEFLQLAWQVGGLALLLYVGSPQSREAEERLEAKLDFLMQQVPGGGSKCAQLDEQYARS